ncbi:MAG: TIGR02450 family Trp-rich protein [Gammaproteobacteria bacterium]
MRQLAPAKLLLSKWTAVQPVRKEKHFIVTALIRDEEEKIIGCYLEAVHSKKLYELDWRELKDSARWLQGWQ